MICNKSNVSVLLPCSGYVRNSLPGLAGPTSAEIFRSNSSKLMSSSLWYMSPSSASCKAGAMEAGRSLGRAPSSDKASPLIFCLEKP